MRQVPELELTAIALEHERTGAKHLHIDRDDANNVFAVGFHTPVSDNTGVPHILVSPAIQLCVRILWYSCCVCT